MKLGTDVKLKSGSALMTVSGMRSDGHIFCMWFDARGKVSRKAFPKETLFVVKPPTRKELEAQRLEDEREEAERQRRVKAMVDEIMGPEDEDEGEDYR
jgi:uncharacterized protein YodC (DUF2158 family)